MKIENSVEKIKAVRRAINVIHSFGALHPEAAGGLDQALAMLSELTVDLSEHNDEQEFAFDLECV